MSGHPELPGPAAAWATVCFRWARTGGVPRTDCSAERSSPVLWRSDAAHGPALVRFHPLSSSAGDDAYPSPCPHPPGPLPCDAHLWVDVDSPERTELMAYADVLVSRVPRPPESARRRVRELLGDRPGCLAAAVPDTATTCVVGVRDRTGAVSFVRPERGGTGAPVPPHVLASVVHAWVAAGRPPRALRSVAPMPCR